MIDINNLKDEAIKHRRELHKIPEIGFCEFKTSKYIEDKLIEYGYEVEHVAKTGLVAYKKGEESNETIAFRADIDALEMTEQTGLSYSSETVGMMHGCGHDGHMSILLTFAKYISTIKKFKKGILLVFQPAEEGPGGAEVIIKEGVFKKYNVTNVFGVHLYPAVQEGKVGVRKGAMTSKCGEFDIDIIAKTGHGAIPHNANDGIVAAAQLISAYQSVVSRNIDPIAPAVLTIGKIVGGERRNIIAGNIRLEGTIRAFDKNIYNTLKNRMVNINHGIEEMFGIKVNMEVRDMYPSVYNDGRLVDLITKNILKDRFVELDPMMIAEDFSYYQEEVPGVFFMVGSKNEELGFVNPLHNSKFNFNENILIDVVKMYNDICVLLEVY